MNDAMLEQIVKEVVKNLGAASGGSTSSASYSGGSGNKVSCKDYPLGAKRKDLVKTPSGKTLDDVTLDSIMKDRIKADDLRITAETLELQAQVAESVGRYPFALNLRRAGELTRIPDNRILEIYNALRPFRSTKAELLAIVDELLNKYQAKITASLVKEAAEVYEKRDRLRRD